MQLRSIQNQTLELRLDMGQIETSILGNLDNLRNCVLMHQDDIHDINALILVTMQIGINLKFPTKFAQISKTFRKLAE